MTRMTGPDGAVMCNLINIHRYIDTCMHACVHTCIRSIYIQTCIQTCIYACKHTYICTVSLIPPWEDQCEWHRMTRMTGPDGAVICNLINIHTYMHTYIHAYIHKYIHTWYMTYLPT